MTVVIPGIECAEVGETAAGRVKWTTNERGAYDI